MATVLGRLGVAVSVTLPAAAYAAAMRADPEPGRHLPRGLAGGRLQLVPLDAELGQQSAEQWQG